MTLILLIQKFVFPGLHFVRGTGSTLGGNLGNIGSSHLQHHTPPIPVEPAVAPVPVLEQESVLDLSQRPSVTNVPLNEENRENDSQNQPRIDVSNSTGATQ